MNNKVKQSPRNLKRLKKKQDTNHYKDKTKSNKVIQYYNYLLTITYDGSTFGGYAKQKFSNTIEGILNTTLDEYFGEHVKLVNASRTDAKVHAIDQKVMFKFYKKINPNKFINYMAENLPKSIEISSIQDIPNEFHARYDVVSKTYIYKIHTEKNIFLNNYSYFWNNEKINIQKVNDICSLFIGTKDFVGFASPKKDSKNTTRTIKFFDFKQIDDTNYMFVINADGFLYNMIRIIISSIIKWYENKVQIDEMENIICSLDPSLSANKLEPHGLYLYEINYK